MIRVFLVALSILFFLIPAQVGAQVEFEKVRGPEGDVSPKDQRRLEMLEQIKGRKAPAEVVERRRERLKKVAQMRTNPAFNEEFKKHYRRLARIVRIHDVARQTGNSSLVEKSRHLLQAEVKRHTRVLKSQSNAARAGESTASETDVIGESSEP